ncbi:MAG: MAPEG family protein [Woeseia sp.]|nr:MAPEG family protein [Woeseia sp.]
MELLAIVTVLALLQVFWFSFQVGKQRQKHDVPAPAMSGPDEFMRAYRVHMNTVEQLIIFLPGLWLFGYYINPTIGAALGLLFIVARFVYQGGYMSDPKKRGPGFIAGWFATVALVLGGLVGAIMRLLAGGLS